MKALEILKQKFSKMYDEAIAEIEGLKNRNCSNCKHSWEPNNCFFYRYYCEEIKISTPGDFYCNRWEQSNDT
jgi:hypothetical protein